MVNVVKLRKMGIVALIVMTMLSATLSAIPVATPDAADQDSAASTQAAIPGYKIDGPKYTNGAYSAVLSAGEYINYYVNLSSAAAIYTYSQLDIVWHLETDWNTSVNVSGPTLQWVYYYEAERTISVTLTSKTNSSNTSTEPINIKIIADLDGDGLPDLWERTYFGTTAATDNPTTTDQDDDGWTDMEEFENDTNPIIPNLKPGFIEQYAWLIAIIAIVVVVIVLFIFIVMPKMKTKRQEDEKKKIAAAVEVEKSLLGLDELEDKPKK